MASTGIITKCHRHTATNRATTARKIRASERNTASTGRHSKSAVCAGTVSDGGTPRQAITDCDQSTATASASEAASISGCCLTIPRHSSRAKASVSRSGRSAA
jgi:hypothetical protein